MPREYFSFGSGIVMNGSGAYGIDLAGGVWSVGAIRLPNNSPVLGRNAANSADIELLRVGTNDVFNVGTGGTPSVSFNCPVSIGWSMSIGDNVLVSLGTTNGTKFGTATSQKIGFWNVAPVAQYTTTGTTTGFTAVSGTAALSGSTYTGGVSSTAYNVADIVRALKLCGIILA